MNVIKEEKIWFSVGCTSPQKELRIRDHARSKGFEAFVPLRYKVKMIRGQKQRTLVPALSGLLFIKGSLEELKDYFQKVPYVVYLKKSTFSNKEDYLTIPTKAMEDFIAVTEHHEERVTYFRPEEISLQEGDKIIIKDGPYEGREGTIIRIKGKRNKCLVVQIPGMLLAAVELSPEMIELPRPASHPEHCRGISPSREKPSKNIDADKKLLLETAQRLLFEIPDKYQHENEYYLLLSELKRTRERLKPFKGFTPTTEAELALPMYLAAVKLNDSIPEAESRLRTVIEKLKDSSKLKATCLSYLEKFSKN